MRKLGILAASIAALTGVVIIATIGDAPTAQYQIAIADLQIRLQTRASKQ